MVQFILWIVRGMRESWQDNLACLSLTTVMWNYIFLNILSVVGFLPNY
jgi:hypothetical protein